MELTEGQRDPGIIRPWLIMRLFWLETRILQSAIAHTTISISPSAGVLDEQRFSFSTPQSTVGFPYTDFC